LVQPARYGFSKFCPLPSAPAAPLFFVLFFVLFAVQAVSPPVRRGFKAPDAGTMAGKGAGFAWDARADASGQ